MRDNLAAVLRHFGPPAAALIGGCLAQWFWQDTLVTILGAAIGALGVSLLVGAPAKPDKPASAPVIPPLKSNPIFDDFSRAVIERVPMGVLIITENGDIEYANVAVRKILGLRGDVPHYLSGLRSRALSDTAAMLFADKTPQSIEFMLNRQNETFVQARLSILPGHARHKRLGLIVIEDRSQALLADATHRDFVANASHELKTPLAVISGIIETLRGHARDDPEATERFLLMMENQATRMHALVRDLLSLNRIEINERVQPSTPCALAQIVQETVNWFSELGGFGPIDFAIADADKDITVLGDRGELLQVFQNILENAGKYGSPGAPVSIRFMTGVPHRPRQIGVAIRDRGPGIAREHLPRLTERFYRVSVPSSREKGGTGLGLAIVKHILNRHRGELEITSIQGKGSTFTAWLPIHG